MLKIKRENFELTGHRFDYELENGVMLHGSEWNGEVYTVKNGKNEDIYRPVMNYNKEDDSWTTVGFED